MITRLAEPKKKKYLEVETRGHELLVRTSKLGPWGLSAGYSCKFEVHANEAAAAKAHEKAVASAQKKGFADFEPPGVRGAPTSLDMDLQQSNDVFRVRDLCSGDRKLTPDEVSKLAYGGALDVLTDQAASGTAIPDIALAAAAGGGADEVVRWLLERGISIEALSSSGYTPLGSAAASGKAKTLALLLDAGAKIDAEDGDSGSTALMHAARNGRAPAVDLLLTRGANAGLRNKKGRSALWYLADEAREKRGDTREALLDGCRKVLAAGVAPNDEERATLATLGVATEGPAPTMDTSQRAAVLGRWQAKKVRSLDSADDDPDWDGPVDGKLSSTHSLELRDDGTFTSQRYGYERAGKWSIHGRNLELKAEYADPIRVELEGSTLVLHDYDEEHAVRLREVYRRA